MTEIRPFSNSTEFIMWNEANCCQCEKNYTCDIDGNNGETKCDIEQAIAISAVMGGRISVDVAERAGLVGGHGYGRSCKEIAEANT